MKKWETNKLKKYFCLLIFIMLTFVRYIKDQEPNVFMNLLVIKINLISKIHVKIRFTNINTYSENVLCIQIKY